MLPNCYTRRSVNLVTINMPLKRTTLETFAGLAKAIDWYRDNLMG